MDVFEAVRNFFEYGFWPISVNETSIALVPKVPVLEIPVQFKPTTLCNFLYTIISKVLVTRLKPVMLVIIFEEQGTNKRKLCW